MWHTISKIYSSLGQSTLTRENHISPPTKRVRTNIESPSYVNPYFVIQKMFTNRRKREHTCCPEDGATPKGIPAAWSGHRVLCLARPLACLAFPAQPVQGFGILGDFQPWELLKKRPCFCFEKRRGCVFFELFESRRYQGMNLWASMG